MRIVIDLQGAQTNSRFRGIGRYSLSLTKAIVRNRGEHEILIAINGLFPDSIEFIRDSFNGLLPQENIKVWYAASPVREYEQGNEWRSKSGELIREAFLASLNPDLVYVTSLVEGFGDDAITSIGEFDTETPVCSSLYDLIPLLNSEQYLDPDPAYQQYYQRKIGFLKRACKLLTISSFSQREAIDNLGYDAASVINISAAITSDFKVLSLSNRETKILLDKFKITSDFILYTGDSDNRKNLPRLIRAYAQLPSEIRNTHQLVFAGNILSDEIQELNGEAASVGIQKNELVYTGYITDDELVKLYNICKLYVFPSWHEGFGLPVLEALSCGAPVIASNATSIPEVLCNENALFDPFSEQSITEKITQVLTDEALRQNLIQQGLKQAKKFSWDKSAKLAINAFEDTVNSLEVKREANDNSGVLIKQIGSLQEKTQPKESDIIEVAKSIAFNSAIFRPKKLLLDISVIVHGDAKSGIQRVVRSILNELLSSPPANYQVQAIYFDGEKYLDANHFVSGIQTDTSLDVSDEVTEFNQGDVYLALDLNMHLTKAVHQLHLHLRDSGVQMYYIVYDILLIHRPDWWPQGLGDDFVEWMKRISQTATGLICISNAVADEVTQWMTINRPERLTQPKVMSFHLGADIVNSSPSKGFLSNSDFVIETLSTHVSFLMVGTIEPRKGHAQTLAAFEKLWLEGQNLSLVLVGKQGWMVEELVEKLRHHPEQGKRLFWLEGISDEYLEQIYAVSTCLIAASEGEGFGLPLIEAAQHKLPIIARDIPVFKEVAGEYAFYFSGKSCNNLSDAIKKWLILYANKEQPSSVELPYLTWAQSANKLKNALGIQ